MTHNITTLIDALRRVIAEIKRMREPHQDAERKVSALDAILEEPGVVQAIKPADAPSIIPSPESVT